MFVSVYVFVHNADDICLIFTLLKPLVKPLTCIILNPKKMYALRYMYIFRELYIYHRRYVACFVFPSQKEGISPLSVALRYFFEYIDFEKPDEAVFFLRKVVFGEVEVKGRRGHKVLVHNQV